MEGNPLIDAGRTSDGTLSLLYRLLDELPLSVAIYGPRPEFPLLYSNRHMAERLRVDPTALDNGQVGHRRLRERAERLVASRRPERLQLNVRGRDGQRMLWAWTLSPLIGPDGEVAAVMAVVEDLSQPQLARQRMETAIDQGMHLLLEVARLAEEHPRMDGFLAAVSERAALLVHADSVTFHTYDPALGALVASAAPDGGPAIASLPCDPAASGLLSQVVFAGRVYTGTLELDNLELRPYAHFVQHRHAAGTRVLMVPWRAGNDRLGAVVATGAGRPEDFTDENAIVLIAAGHAAGLVWQRKRAEQKLEERAEELASLERVKSSFLKLASHELRTPVTLLNGYVSMLADGSRGPERVAEILPILQQALDRMNALVDQLMDATRLADGKIALQRQPVDLRDAVQRAADRVVARWPRRADFELQLPDAPVTATVDVDRIETAVANLVDNAFKYSEPGEQVRCELSKQQAAARLVVRDEGIGMTAEELNGLFTRFGREVNAKNSHIAGSGLGLFLAREIARLHGGDITAASRAGLGSSFELTLPLWPAGGA